MRNERVAVVTAKARALSSGLGRGDATEVRKTKFCDDGEPGQCLTEQCSPVSVCAKGHPTAANKKLPSKDFHKS